MPDSHAMATYSYASVLAGAFRLMRILPGHGEDPVAVTLHVHDLDTPPDYEALSYAWGDANDTCVVTVNHGQLLITRSLHSALYRLRRAQEPRLIWADGICIDQSNIFERSQQVAQMYRVFSGATVVYAYLGEVAEESEDVPMLLHEVRESVNAHGKNPSSLFLMRPDGDLTNRALSFIRVLSRRWFTRVWVLQEVVAAKEVKFFCGSWAPDFDEMMFLVDAFARTFSSFRYTTEEHRGLFLGLMDGLNLLGAVKALQQSVSPSEGTSYGLLHILACTRVMKASDARDHIFAILGLSSESNDPELRPDYDVSPSALYIKVAKFLVNKGEGIQILHNASIDDNKTYRQLPSWVPDWSSELKPSSFCSVLPDVLWGKAFGGSCFRAAGYTETHMITTQDLSMVQVKGILFDNISTRLDAPEHALYSDEETTLIALHAIEELSTLIGPSYPTGEDKSLVTSHIATCGLRTGKHFAEPGCQISSAERREEFIPYLRISKLLAKLNKEPSMLGSICNILRAHNKRFIDDVVRFSTAFRKAKSTRGYVGQVPLSAQVGDVIFVPFGSSVPMIIRPCGNGYTLVGVSYIHGIMHGEALLLSDGKEETITLV